MWLLKNISKLKIDSKTLGEQENIFTSMYNFIFCSLKLHNFHELWGEIDSLFIVLICYIQQYWINQAKTLRLSNHNIILKW